MAGNLECPVLREKYNTVKNKPMSLPCGHTVCENCLEAMYNGMTNCPLCHQNWPNKKWTQNYGLIEALRASETQCTEHNAFATSICVTHVVPKCEQCTHQARDCVFKDLAEDAAEISETVNGTIRKVFDKIRCPKALQEKVRQLFTMTLTEKIKFYFELNQKPCEGCGEIAETMLDIENLRYYCKKCSKQAAKQAAKGPVMIVILHGAALADMKAQIMKRIWTDLKNVNSCQVSVQLFNGLTSPPESIDDCVALSKNLKELVGMKVTELSALPDPVVCLGCCQSFPRANLRMRVLPCRNVLHTVCEPCALRMVSNWTVECPWHHNIYGIGQLEELPMLQLKAPASDGIEVPKYRMNETYPYSVNLFTTVMPPGEIPQTEWPGKNEGYTVDFSVNQVEALTFMSYRDSQLIGLGLSNPVLPGKMIGVEWVKFYVGESAQREPAWRSSANPNQLYGGNAVLTDVYFETPYHLSAMKNYTLKFKFQQLSPDDQKVLLFRGNHLTRKENLAGDDETAWTCVQTHGVESEERCFEQLFLTGPIIRLIYY